MPNLGLIGAIGGAAKGVEQSALLDLEEARSRRLENLRAKNQGELNAQRRSDSAAISAESDARRQEYSLESLMKADELARSKEDRERSRKLEDRESYDLLRDDQGNITGQVEKNTGKWSSAGKTANTGYASRDTRPNDQKMIEFLMRPQPDGTSGMSREKAIDLILNKKNTGSKTEWIQDAAAEMAKYGIDPDVDMLNRIAGRIFPEDEAMSGGSDAGAQDTGADGPPVPGARQAQDGNWYLKQGDTWYRVD